MRHIAVDPLMPLVGKNRNEFFLIEYEHYIVNMAESLIQQSFYNKEYTLSRYPGMQRYWDMGGFGRYVATAKFTPLQILEVLNEKELSDEELQNDLRNWGKIDVLPYMTETVFLPFLDQISTEKFVRGIHIIKDGEMHRHEYDYLVQVVLPPVQGKDIQYFSGDTPSICKDFSYTTIMMNGIQKMRNLIESEPKKYQNTLFLVNPYFGEDDLCEDLIAQKYNIRIIEINYTGIDKLIHPLQPMG